MHMFSESVWASRETIWTADLETLSRPGGGGRWGDRSRRALEGSEEVRK